MKVLHSVLLQMLSRTAQGRTDVAAARGRVNNEQLQVAWMGVVCAAAVPEGEAPPAIAKHMARLAGFACVPQDRTPFIGFVERSLDITDGTAVGDMFGFLWSFASQTARDTAKGHFDASYTPPSRTSRRIQERGNVVAVT